MLGMSESRSRIPESLPWLLRAENWWKAYFLGWVPVASAYLIILGLFLNIDGITLVSTWLANIIVPLIMGLGVSWIVLNLLIERSVHVQLLSHSIGSVVFSTLWALGAFRLLQVSSGLIRGDWSPPVWPSAALAWQLFQGLAIYFTIASATYAYWAIRTFRHAQITEGEDAQTSRIFAKTPTGILPIGVSEIDAVRSIDGLTYIVRRGEKLESRLSLGELEDKLPSSVFLRVHRSALINLNHIQSIEPAGNGRLTVHLSSGLSLETSRSGTAALKGRLALV